MRELVRGSEGDIVLVVGLLMTGGEKQQVMCFQPKSFFHRL